MVWLPLIFVVLQFSFIGLGLLPKYRYKALFTTWPDWAVLISWMCAMSSAAIWILTK